MNIPPAGTTLASLLRDELASHLDGASKDAIYCDESASSATAGETLDAACCDPIVSAPTQTLESSVLPSTPERALRGFITVYPANEYD